MFTSPTTVTIAITTQDEWLFHPGKFLHVFRSVDNYRLLFNPLVTNGVSHRYQMGESIFIDRGTRSEFSLLFHFSMKLPSANRIAPDGTSRSAASYLRLYCLLNVP